MYPPQRICWNPYNLFVEFQQLWMHFFLLLSSFDCALVDIKPFSFLVLIFENKNENFLFSFSNLETRNYFSIFCSQKWEQEMRNLRNFWEIQENKKVLQNFSSAENSSKFWNFSSVEKFWNTVGAAYWNHGYCYHSVNVITFTKTGPVRLN